MGQKRHFREILPFDTHSKSKLLPLATVEKIQYFFQKTHLFLNKRVKVLNVLRNPTISFAFQSKFASFRDFKNFQTFSFEKTHLFCQENPNFERFENLCHSSRIPRQICCKLVKKIHVQKREPTSIQRDLNW